MIFSMIFSMIQCDTIMLFDIMYIVTPTQLPSKNPSQMSTETEGIEERCTTEPYCEAVSVRNILEGYGARHIIQASNIPDALWNFPDGFDETNVYLSDFTIYAEGTHYSFGDMEFSIYQFNSMSGNGANQKITFDNYNIASNDGIFDFGMSNDNS